MCLGVLTGLEEGTIESLVQEADLMRIHGVGPVFAHLLRLAGVRSVQDLTTWNGTELVDAMFEANLAEGGTASLPTERQAANWIVEASELSREVTD
jgi:predicted flap endonuclease-1-like 5' DNA nuclease